MAASRRTRTAQLALLLFHPPISVLYLVTMRGGGVEPRLLPVVLLGLFPLMALLLDVVYRMSIRSRRPRDVLVTALALGEVLWAVLCIAAVNAAAIQPLA
jgi:hypothetical protein